MASRRCSKILTPPPLWARQSCAPSKARRPERDDALEWQAAQAAVEHAAAQGIVIALENYVGCPAASWRKFSGC
ncbi:MAG: hypothetical protein R2911_04745 [Caldilineaceae bacterium]